MNGHDPLTPEERELARLLGTRQHKAPSAAMDAAILAAARASLHTGSTADTGIADATETPSSSELPRRHRGGGRWPAVFGIAASVVFAVGLAWQMRPEPPQAPVREAMAPLATRDADASAPDPLQTAPPESVPPVASEPTTAPAATPAPAEAEAEAPAQAAHASRPEVRARRAPASEPAPPPTAVELTSMPVPRAPVAAPMPPAPSAPEAFPAPAAARQQAADAVLERYSAPASAPASARAARSLQSAPAAAPGVMQRKATPSLNANDVQAEVQADSRLTRRQWLQKIRHRRDAGEVDLARASLERYLLQYPETRLPRDLRPLLAD